MLNQQSNRYGFVLVTRSPQIGSDNAILRDQSAPTNGQSAEQAPPMTWCTITRTITALCQATAQAVINT